MHYKLKHLIVSFMFRFIHLFNIYLVPSTYWISNKYLGTHEYLGSSLKCMNSMFSTCFFDFIFGYCCCYLAAKSC